MDPWSKVDYSRFIREASMVVEKLPVVVPLSGRVPGRGLLVLPIFEARRRRNRGINRRKGTARGGPGAPGAPLARPGVRPRSLAAWGPPGSPLAPLGIFAKLSVC